MQFTVYKDFFVYLNLLDVQMTSNLYQAIFDIVMMSNIETREFRLRQFG